MIVHEIKVVKEETEYYSPKTRLRPNLVLVNNKEVNYGISYNDTSREYTLIFVNTIYPGDIIRIDYETNLSKVVSKNPYSRNCIYPLYTSDVKFKLNHKYDFFVKAREDYNSSFKVKYDPFYSTIDRIRIDTGNLLDNVSDDVISSIIHDNSKLVIEKLGGTEEAESVFEEGIPMYVKNFVRYKTDLDLCYAIYLSKTGKLGAFKKKIGDLDVSNEVKLPALSEMLSRFKELLKPNEDLLDGNNATDLTVGFVKAQSTDYPVSTRGIF